MGRREEGETHGEEEVLYDPNDISSNSHLRERESGPHSFRSCWKCKEKYPRTSAIRVHH